MYIDKIGIKSWYGLLRWVTKIKKAKVVLLGNNILFSCLAIELELPSARLLHLPLAPAGAVTPSQSWTRLGVIREGSM